MVENLKVVRERNFKSIWRLYFMLAYCLGILPVNIENLLIYLPGATPSGIGLAAASRLAVGIVSVLVFGYFGEKLAEKFSRRKIFLCTNLVWIISYGLISISIDFNFYFILVVISAIGAGAFVPIGFSILADSFEPKERGSKYGLMSFGMIIGGGAGIIFGGLLGNYAGPLGWRLAYALGGIIGILALISYYNSAIDPERGRIEPEFKDFEGSINYNYKITYHQVTQLLKKKSILGLFLYVLCAGIANTTLGIWAIFYISTKINDINAGLYATTIYIFAGIGAIPGTILGGKFGDSLYHSGKLRGRVIISSIGIIVGTLCFLGFYLIPFKMDTPLEIALSWIFFITIGFFGFFLTSLCNGNIFAIYSEVCVPEARSTANSLNGLMSNLGGIIGNLLLSALIINDLGVLPFAISLLLYIWLLSSVLWIIPYIYYPKEYKECRELMSKRRFEMENNKKY